MYGRRRSLPLEILLILLSFLYRTAVGLRQLAYRSGILRIRSLPVPVISVGNITLGGTGKTPAVVHIAGALAAQGYKTAVLSRGYGRKQGAAIQVVSDGKSILAGPDLAGDEPCMIAHRLGGVSVVVGKDRYHAGIEAMKRFQPERIVLDDGFQHLRLKRNRNIAVIDGSDPFGSGRLFPAGILREPPSSLKRADAVLITRADCADDLEYLRRTIRKYTSARIFSAVYRPEDLVEIATGNVRPLEVLRNANVVAFAGIARPASFEKTLLTLDADLVSFRHFPDHYRYGNADLRMLIEDASRSASLLVTTEKDGVKLRPFSPRGVWMLRVGLEVHEPETWKETVWEAL